MLTAKLDSDYALATAPHWAGGFGSPISKGARAMRRKSRGFFYASRFLAGGVWGSFAARRTLCPVYQPCASSAALSLVASVGGFNPSAKELSMTTQSKTTPEIRPYVEILHGELKTTSIKVAEHFGKQHKDVLKRIQNLDCSSEFIERNFALIEVEAEVGFGTRKSPAYEITKDGFMFLAMGFTGKRAAQWKEAYINAFNAMESELLGKAEQLPEPKTKKALPGGLTLEQQDCIKALVKDRALELPKEKQAGAIIKQWSAIKKKFGVSYKAVSPDNFTHIISLLARLPLECELPKLESPHTDDRLLSDKDYRAKARTTAIDYIDACQAAVKAAGGVPPKWPEIPQELADGILMDMLMSQRFLLSFDYDMRLRMSQIPKNASVLDPNSKTSMETLMREYIPGDLLPELMQIALDRLTRAAKRNQQAR
jgi:Rha family phage regulatory protein